jgi:hypothetical protein
VILAAGAAYLALSDELAGATMMLAFAGAMTFFMWVLVPTFDHEGNTAPIDPDFPEPDR